MDRTAYKRAWYLANRENEKAKARIRTAKFRAKFPERAAEASKNSRNKDKRREYKRKYEVSRRKSDLSYRLLYCLRARLGKCLRGTFTAKTRELLGCGLPELISHLERQFKSGMSWDNYGEWHIDHIVPCFSFDMTKESEVRRCFHFSNLQPLWAGENHSKNGRRTIPREALVAP